MRGRRLNWPPLARRAALAFAALGSLGARLSWGAAAPAWQARPLASGEPLRQIHAGGPSGLLAVGASGTLWALALDGAAPRRLGQGLDAATPLATGHGRIAARSSEGGLWLWEVQTSRVASRTPLAVHAGLLNLPTAVVGVVATGSEQQLVRIERDTSKTWREVARSSSAVLPDARPLMANLDGSGEHIVVFAGPSSMRYQHAVLGDAVEPTRLLWLERHSLQVLRSLSLPAPYVFEDIAPRPLRLAQGQGEGLLTMRSGPTGGQLALVLADPLHADGLQLAALGDSVGGRHRWLAASTDGQRMVAVHTPHIGGILHEYQRDGERLLAQRLSADVCTHRIGSRETDLAVWLGPLLIGPSQDGRRLRAFDATAGWSEVATAALPSRVVMSTRLAAGGGLVVLLEEGVAMHLRAPLPKR